MRGAVGAGLAAIGAAALTGLTTSVQRSRVDTGQMRNSWDVCLLPSDAEPRKGSGADGDPPSAEQLQSAERTIKQAGFAFNSGLVQGPLVIYLVNPVEYSSYVDEDYPMVDPAIEAMNAALRANQFTA